MIAILLKKSPIEVEKLFENIEGERKVILIDGAPGSGISTLTVRICQRWSRGEHYYKSLLSSYSSSYETQPCKVHRV